MSDIVCEHGQLRRSCHICEMEDEIERLRSDLEICHILRKTTAKMQRFISDRGWGNAGDNMAEILMDRITAAESVIEAAKHARGVFFNAWETNETCTQTMQSLGEALRDYDAAKGAKDDGGA